MGHVQEEKNKYVIHKSPAGEFYTYSHQNYNEDHQTTGGSELYPVRDADHLDKDDIKVNLEK